MLGRTANGMFWMFRYLERAENTARLLEAGLRMALTRDVVTAENEWRSVIATSGQQAAYEANNDGYSGTQAWNFVLRDKANPASIREMLAAVRTNARMARTNISSEVWEAVNESWMELDAKLSRPVGQGAIGDVLGTIRQSAALVHGAFHGTILRNEGYHFARAGTYVERAESTARILDMKYFLLLPSLSHVGSSLDTGQWEQVLRSVAGARAYSWLNAGQIEARGIVEFLVLDDRFPRSLAFCRSALGENLAELARMHGEEGSCNRLMQEADSEFDALNVDDIFDRGLHDFWSTSWLEIQPSAPRLPKITGSWHEALYPAYDALSICGSCRTCAAAAPAHSERNARAENSRLGNGVRKRASPARI